MRHLLLALLLLLPVTVLGQHSHGPAKEPAPATLESGLGDINHPVSTNNAEAQKFFNQGLAYVYAFNHDEAIRSFKRATELDPQLAMGYWGMALALGSNYNVQAEGTSLAGAYTNLQKAIELAPKASAQDQAYIAALAKRYSADLRVDQHKLAVDYKNAMGELVKRYPDDLDAATLYAESMMNLHPWKLWTLDGKPAEGTLEIVAVLEGVLRRNPNHSGANHYYIHAVEASTNPDRALASAARLGQVAPKAGHLVHMPSHIYSRTGDYAKAAQANVDAIAVDREYLKTGVQGVYPVLYYNHNMHFLAAASAANGRYADSIKAARELEASVKPMVKAMPMLEMFAPYPLVSMVRFGRWDEILKEPQPDEALKLTTGFWHFARGSAFVALKQTENAEAELKALEAVTKTVSPDAMMFTNPQVAILNIADVTLAGKIAFARGDKQTAVSLLTKAAAAEDATAYAEPADWDLPVREVLGGVLLSAGDNSAAEKVFSDELLRHHRSGRAYFGLAESLKRQGKKAEADKAARDFAQAWKDADTKLTANGLAGVTVTKSASNSAPIQFSSVALETGVRLRYAYQGDPKGKPIVMLHGFTDSWFSFSPVLPLLDRKYRVYILDQRGHGESDRPASGYAMDQFAGDVIAFMDAMKIKQATIVGHSMGSFVAQHVAAQAPERVNRLVLVATATTVHTNELARDLQRDVNALSDPVPEKFVREFQVSTTFEALPQQFLDAVVKESLKLPARVWREVMAGMMSPDASVARNKIKTPTLILWGDKDFFPRAEQESLVAALPNAQLKVYTDTGHALHWERPERFAADLEAFIN